MARDTRLFRITRMGGQPKFGGRLVAGTSAAAHKSRWGKPILKIEATNWDATEGWTDVTAEFLGDET